MTPPARRRRQPPAAGADAPPGTPARIAALRAVRRVTDGGEHSVPALHAELDACELERPDDRALTAALAYETLRWQGTLDWALGHVSHRPLERLDPAVRDALRLGAWQLLHGRMPAAAAVTTTVAAAKVVAGGRVGGFVNGVLRELARRQRRLPWPPRDTDRGLALAHGYPEWIVAAARGRFGARAEAVLEAGNTSPGVTLRATGGPDAREALLAELREQGLAAEPARLAAESVRVPGADPGRLAAVAEGRAVVQDEASTLVGRAAAHRAGPGALAVDLCAAPGGKTGHLAEQGLRVVALDRDLPRLRQLLDGLVAHPARSQVHAATADAARPPLAPAVADVVLLDAPCTGLGVVRRRPELRWRLARDDPARLAAVQERLLRAAAGLVAVGGVLCYSVCSWTLEETTGVAAGLRSALGARWTVVDGHGLALAAAARPDPDDRLPGVQLSPDVDDVDGMYVHTWRRDG